MGNRVSAGVGLFNDDGSLVIEPTGRIRVAGAGGGSDAFVTVPSRPGEDQTAEVADALAAASAAATAFGDGRRLLVRLGVGEFLFSAAVLQSSNTELRGSGEGLTIVAPFPGSYADIGRVDDAANAFHIVGGVVDETFTTVLTDAITENNIDWYGANTRRLSLATTTGLLVGDWIRTHGWETAIGQNPGGGAGRDIIVDELLRVAEIDGDVVVLQFPTVQHHVTQNDPGAVGDEVLRVDRVLPAENVAVSDLTYDARGAYVANGIMTELATGLDIRRVRFVGMTRLGIELRRGSRDAMLESLTWSGCNGGAGFLSANTFVGSLLRGDPNGPRFREVGVIRAQIWVYRLTVNYSFYNLDLRRGCQGIWLHAQRDGLFAGFTIDDMDITEKYARDNLLGGVGINSGTVSLNETIYGDMVTTVCGRLSNLRSPQSQAPNPLFFAIWYHDVYGWTSDDIQVANDGLGPYALVDGIQEYFTAGVAFQDTAGTFSNHVIKGCENAIIWRSGQGCLLKDWTVLGTPGALGSASPTVGMYLMSYHNSELIVDGLTLQGGIFFAPEFVADPVGNRFVMRNILLSDIGRFPVLELGVNNSGATRVGGTVLVANGSTAEGIVSAVLAGADAADRLKLVVAAPTLSPAPNGGYCFFAPQGSGFIEGMLVDSTINVDYGDRFVAVPGQDTAIVDNAATGSAVIGRSMSSRAAFAPSPPRVKVTPAPG